MKRNIKVQIICNLKYSIPKKIPIFFHYGSNYDYHFIIKELVEESKKQYTFTVPVETEVTRIDKNGEEITRNISYILQFIDSARFIASLLSNLVNNISEGIHTIKCKYWHGDKKCASCGIRCEVCDCFLEYKNFKDDLM